MRNLKFKLARAKNFLCFGNKGVEINFENYGNIVCVKATNLDIQNSDEKTNSNGVGKSSCAEIAPYALFGKTIKKPNKLKHKQVINNKTEEDMEVEFHYDDCKIIRKLTSGKNPSATLQYWKKVVVDDVEVWKDFTQNIGPTQDLIIKDLGLSYEAFINIYIFTDDSTTSFLECDTPTRREIVENTLSLEKYRTYSDVVKKLIKECKEIVKELTSSYEHRLSVLEASKKRLIDVEKQEKDWKTTKANELSRLLKNLQAKNDELNTTNSGSALSAYKDAQEQIGILQTSISSAETSKGKLNELLVAANEKYVSLSTEGVKLKNKIEDYQSKIKDCKVKITQNQKIIDDIDKKIGKECPYCLNSVDESKFLSMKTNASSIVCEQNEILSKLNLEFEPINKDYDANCASSTKITKGIADCKAKIESFSKNITTYQSEISRLSKIKEPDTGLEEQRIAGQIEELKKQIVEKQEEIGISPFDTIKVTTIAEIDEKSKDAEEKKKEIKDAEKELPYYDFWLKAFGDNGIRKYIIDEIIPSLNARIEYWLQYLIDNKIKLEFDNQLNATIDRWPYKGRLYVYEGCSGGQRRRLNLTVSQAFAHIRMLNCGASPSVVFLDEVTMNMDESGIEGIYRMIVELSKEKQVFVIDHNPILLQMLDGCEQIQLEMKNEVTTMVDLNILKS